MQKLIGFRRHDLSDGLTFWVGQLPASLALSPIRFGELWGLHPTEYNEIHMHGRRVKIPRWQKAFGKNYHFSGQTSEAASIPPLLAPLLAWVRQDIDDRLNGMLVNWYDGQLGHYIGPHRDSRVNMIQGAPIVTISLGEEQTFRLCPWRGSGFVDFSARDGTVFVMPYDTNLAWTHAVPAARRQTGRRISVTLRGLLDDGVK